MQRKELNHKVDNSMILNSELYFLFGGHFIEELRTDSDVLYRTMGYIVLCKKAVCNIKIISKTFLS